MRSWSSSIGVSGTAGHLSDVSKNQREGERERWLRNGHLPCALWLSICASFIRLLLSVLLLPPKDLVALSALIASNVFSLGCRGEKMVMGQRKIRLYLGSCCSWRRVPFESLYHCSERRRRRTMHSYSPPAEFVRPVVSGRREKTK